MHKSVLCIALIPLACSSHDPCDRPFVEMGQCITENLEGTRRSGPGFQPLGIVGGINGTLSAGEINGTLSAGEINGTTSAGAINGTTSAGAINGSLSGVPSGGGGEGVDTDAACESLCSPYLSCTVKPAAEEFFNREATHSECVVGCDLTRTDHPACFASVQSAAAMCSAMTDCFDFGECLFNAGKGDPACEE